jgi:hypothetical protein
VILQKQNLLTRGSQQLITPFLQASKSPLMADSTRIFDGRKEDKKNGIPTKKMFALSK